MALVGDFASSPVYLYTVNRRGIRTNMCRCIKHHTFTKYGNKMIFFFYNISINMHHRHDRHTHLSQCMHFHV